MLCFITDTLNFTPLLFGCHYYPLTLPSALVHVSEAVCLTKQNEIFKVVYEDETVFMQ